MPNNSFRYILPFSFVIFLLGQLFLPASTAQALSDPSSVVEIPSLEAFVEEVSNGQEAELRGVYIPGIAAAPVVQQPDGRNDFVSPWQNVVTQFGMASRLGSTGLLAHNYLAGETFALLEKGQEIHLIRGDGQISTFIVTEILQYQALASDNISGSFLDLKTQSLTSAADLFRQVYNRPGQLIFQTCIQSGSDPNWGRLFVIAEPVS